MIIVMIILIIMILAPPTGQLPMGLPDLRPGAAQEVELIIITILLIMLIVIMCWEGVPRAPF